MYTSKGKVCLFKHNQVGTSEIWAIIKLIWVTWMSVYQHCKNAYTISSCLLMADILPLTF